MKKYKVKKETDLLVSNKKKSGTGRTKLVIKQDNFCKTEMIDVIKS